jgi:hypothetical protein
MLRRQSAVCVAASIFVLALLNPAAARGQASDQKLSEIIAGQYFDQALVQVLAFQSVFPGLPFSTLRDSVTNQFVTSVALPPIISTQVSAFPLGSSAGGFTWTFDPALGTVNRVSSSFGPVFAERGLNVGRGRLNLGVNYQRATFDKIQDRQLDEGEITTYTGFVIGSTTAFFENKLYLKLNTDTVGVFATYGITDRVDVGIALPFEHVDLESRLDARAAVNNNFSSIITGDTISDSASGIGDVVVRGKFSVLKMAGGGVAAGVDLRLPTGDEEELLGIAGGQAKIYVAGSGGSGRVAPHVNFGYTVSGESDAAKSADTFLFAPPDEINYAGGVDVAVTPRLTVVGDVLGRTLRDFVKLDFTSTQFGSNYRQFSISDGNMNLLLGAAGVKFNPAGKGLVTFSVLFPLNNNGLTDKLTWLAGGEVSF